MRLDRDWVLGNLDGDVDVDAVVDGLTACGFNVELREAFGDSEVWDVEITANRPDAMNHRGLAREAAVAVGASLRPLDCDLIESDEPADNAASVEISDPELCSRYVARVIRGVAVVESPQWLKDRLERCGIRPINAAVDATNYVLMGLGQPLHAFDLDRLSEHRIVVRRALEGEELTTLDGESRKLGTDDLVIADSDRAVALAGIMGGGDSEIDAATTDILLESAHFDPVTVRRTARRLGLHTEASHRFERGCDPEMAGVAADVAAALIVELCGGQVSRGRIDAYPRVWQPRQVTLSVAELSAFAGLAIAGDEVGRILGGLDFEPEIEGDRVLCSVPSFRVDVERSADLYEEVIRHVGYDAVPAQLPVLVSTPGERRGSWELVDRCRDAAVAAGLIEVVTYSFIEAEDDRLAEALPLCPGDALELVNPLAATQATMRRSLLPSLIIAVRDNLNHGESSVSIFEQGRVYARGDGDTIERERLAVALCGDSDSQGSSRAWDFTHLKGMVEAVLERVGFPRLSWTPGGAPWLDESRAAVLSTADGTSAGVVGRLSESMLDRWELRQPVYVAELDLSLAESEQDLPRFTPLPRFPAVSVDMTVEHPVELSFEQLLKSVSDLAGKRVERISLQSRFSGKGLPGGVIRTTLRLVYRDLQRSLTQDEVNSEHQVLRTRLAEQVGVDFA